MKAGSSDCSGVRPEVEIMCGVKNKKSTVMWADKVTKTLDKFPEEHSQTVSKLKTLESGSRMKVLSSWSHCWQQQWTHTWLHLCMEVVWSSENHNRSILLGTQKSTLTTKPNWSKLWITPLTQPVITNETHILVFTIFNEEAYRLVHTCLMPWLWVTSSSHLPWHGWCMSVLYNVGKKLLCIHLKGLWLHGVCSRGEAPISEGQVGQQEAHWGL